MEKLEKDLEYAMTLVNAQHDIMTAMAKGRVNKYNLLELDRKEYMAVIDANHRGFENSKKTKGNYAALVLIDALAMPKDTRLFLDCESFDEIEQWYAVFGFDESIILFLEDYKRVCEKAEWYRMAHNLSKAIEHYKKHFEL